MDRSEDLKQVRDLHLVRDERDREVEAAAGLRAGNAVVLVSQLLSAVCLLQDDPAWMALLSLTLVWGGVKGFWRFRQDQERLYLVWGLLTCAGAAALLGLDRGEVLRVLSMLHAVSGRFEKIRAANGTTAIVDYAHTPDALENVIQTIEEIRTPGQQLIVVCGCGGDRDRTKRPEMAAIAVKYATTAVFTSDNPRHESPEAILDDMVAGLEPGARYLRIADRAEAIRTAVMLSRPGDIILVAGKGHETYQIVGDVKHPFDDREEIKKRFALLN